MVMEERLEFPILNFEKCPVCGSTRRFAGEILRQQKEAGKLSKEVVGFITQCQSIMAGPVGTWLSAPVILSFYDVCVECGTMYCIHAEVQTIVQGGKNLPNKERYKSGDRFTPN